VVFEALGALLFFALFARLALVRVAMATCLVGPVPPVKSRASHLDPADRTPSAPEPTPTHPGGDRGAHPRPGDPRGYRPRGARASQAASAAPSSACSAGPRLVGG
jgi:hypothetical protein